MKDQTRSDETVTNLQMLIERDKASLARELHDDLGGYLVASAMDVSDLKRRFGATDAEALSAFTRLSKTLNSAIDLTRRVTEELQPTLLDNVGLFAALRWQIKQMCHRSSIHCAEHLPDVEPPLGHAAAITLYRCGQEGLITVENHPGVKHVDFSIAVDQDTLTMDIVADGLSGVPTKTNRGDVSLEFLRRRVRALGGNLTLMYPEMGGVRLTARVRLADAIALDHAQMQ